MINKKYDVVIVGAGPAGSACAICLKDSGLKLAIIDKAVFPRDKTCGDGLTMDVTNQLPMISKELYETFLNFQGKVPSWGSELIYSNGMHISFNHIIKGENRPIYLCRRRDFDNLLFQHIKQQENIDIFENCIPKKIIRENNCISLETNQGVFECSIIVGSDGVNSFVSHQMGIKQFSKDQKVVSLRTYYSGVKPLNDNNPIELYLFKDSIPGYLWIFNMGDGVANVGFGMVASIINKKKIKLKKHFEELLQREPLKSRLKDAVMIEPVKGNLLSVGGFRRDISGERFVLTGDAAALADPLSGEGVGNALRSGRVAADHIINCFKDNCFSASYNKAYDKEIYRRMLSELRFHGIMQNIFSTPWLINYFISSVANYRIIRNSLQNLLNDLKVDNTVQKLSFALKLFYIFTLKKLYVSIFFRKEANN